MDETKVELVVRKSERRILFTARTSECFRFAKVTDDKKVKLKCEKVWRMDYSHYMYLRRQVEDEARRSVHEDTRFISFVSCLCKMYSSGRHNLCWTTKSNHSKTTTNKVVCSVRKLEMYGRPWCYLIQANPVQRRGMTVTSGVVTISKDAGNLIGISIGGGAPLCPCLYIVQVAFSWSLQFLRCWWFPSIFQDGYHLIFVPKLTSTSLLFDIDLLQVFDNTPAAKEGTLESGDELVGINDTNVKVSHYFEAFLTNKKHNE